MAQQITVLLVKSNGKTSSPGPYTKAGRDHTAKLFPDPHTCIVTHLCLYIHHTLRF